MKQFLFFTSVFALTQLSAQTTSALEKNVPQAIKESSLMDILAKGGLVMIPLGLLSFFTVLMILTFLMTIRRNAVVSDSFMNKVDDLIKNRDIQGLKNLSANEGQCMARVTQKVSDYLLKNKTATMEEVREVIEVEGSRQGSALIRKIAYLADIGSIAPMIGLLGTVIGMMKSFVEIGSSGVQGVKQMQLAVGVSEALTTTASGLAICIPAMIFYSYFRGKTQRFNADLSIACSHVASSLNAQFQAVKLARREPAAYAATENASSI